MNIIPLNACASQGATMFPVRWKPYPSTLLGELVVINTDILAWIVALQILHPGTPLLYGSVSAVLDMRTGLLPLGAPERGMINSGAAAMARHYSIPSMCGGLSSDAKRLDAQAGFEKAVTAVPLLLEGADIIYGIGAIDAGATISYTQMVLDDDLAPPPSLPQVDESSRIVV